MCTVVCRWIDGEPVRILALRDEFVERHFDGPGAWWPEHPDVVGGRDRLAGGSWCVSDVRTGATALVVNRIERRTGTPSRGVLPLAAMKHGPDWPSAVDVSGMAAFNLVLAHSSGVAVWSWDAARLARTELHGGTHMITSCGIDADDPKTRRFAPRFAAEQWAEVVTSCTPSDDPSALVVRRTFGEHTYATVFGQLVEAVPGALRIEHSRTPWVAGSWSDQRWA